MNINEISNLRQTIISQCVWSEKYRSLKHIVKQAANQLPLLVSFVNDDSDNDNNPEQKRSNNLNEQIIFFFDRNVSNKTLFSPLRQLDDESNSFEVYPKNCTFAITDLFQGIFEFVLNGKRCSRIYKNLKQLIDFATNNQCSIVFMSRDVIKGCYRSSNGSNWISKQYQPGAIFHGRCIHYSSSQSNKTDDYLECLDEDSYSILLHMFNSGRFSLIATSLDQQQNQPEIFLHSTQTPNIGQFIKRLISNDKINNCIRLVRGPVPHNFNCQHLRFIHQNTYDIIIGVTDEGLVIEWNLDSHTPCRYATNLNEILNKLSETQNEQILENYMDQARSHYRENFQINMQLISTQDCSKFLEFWKWTGDFQQVEDNQQSYPSSSSNRFHLVASIQDLTDDHEVLISKFTKHFRRLRISSETHRKEEKTAIEKSRHSFPTGKSKILLKPSNQIKKQTSLVNTGPTNLLLMSEQKLFDDRIYDSNQNHQSLPNITKIDSSKKNARRTQ